jgi:hypothetical protein
LLTPFYVGTEPASFRAPLIQARCEVLARTRLAFFNLTPSACSPSRERDTLLGSTARTSDVAI